MGAEIDYSLSTEPLSVHTTGLYSDQHVGQAPILTL